VGQKFIDSISNQLLFLQSLASQFGDQFMSRKDTDREKVIPPSRFNRAGTDLASFDAIIDAGNTWRLEMRTTIALDDELVRTAQEFTGVSEKAALIREALKALIERESARRLASLGGSMPGLKSIPRRRTRQS